MFQRNKRFDLAIRMTLQCHSINSKSEMKWFHYWKLRTRGELKLNFPVSNGNSGSNSFAVLAELFPAVSADYDIGELTGIPQNSINEFCNRKQLHHFRIL